MPGGALCQVQNIPTHATRKAGELKRSKKVTTKVKDENEKNRAETENENLKGTSAKIEEKLNETNVLKAKLLHESPDTIEVFFVSCHTTSSVILLSYR
ncbi:unnamed protein product [Onchocerca flexuosa]|uniref:BZIP domain-containing protein n=1 Tax=Onchocerca flexuosa TaxID=387005 RepID=A0A183HXB1_9BILA|nr:unnamed protein product [Onchocerca flexuosa]